MTPNEKKILIGSAIIIVGILIYMRKKISTCSTTLKPDSKPEVITNTNKTVKAENSATSTVVSNPTTTGQYYGAGTGKANYSSNNYIFS